MNLQKNKINLNKLTKQKFQPLKVNKLSKTNKKITKTLSIKFKRLDKSIRKKKLS